MIMDQRVIDTAVKQAREVMDGFMVAFNAEDADAMRERWFNFPHVRFHSAAREPLCTRLDGHWN